MLPWSIRNFALVELRLSLWSISDFFVESIEVQFHGSNSNEGSLNGSYLFYMTIKQIRL